MVDSRILSLACGSLHSQLGAFLTFCGCPLDENDKIYIAYWFTASVYIARTESMIYGWYIRIKLRINRRYSINPTSFLGCLLMALCEILIVL